MSIELSVLDTDGGASELHTPGQIVQIAVSDTGPGLSAEAAKHLFDPFYSGREAGRGLGFGLCKCWRIVEQHGGSIDVSSTPGQGAASRSRSPPRNKRAKCASGRHAVCIVVGGNFLFAVRVSRVEPERNPAMKRMLLFSLVVFALASVAQAQVYVTPAPTVTYYAPSMPVTTYDAPSVSTPVTAYYAPSTVTTTTPVTTYYGAEREHARNDVLLAERKHASHDVLLAERSVDTRDDVLLAERSFHARDNLLRTQRGHTGDDLLRSGRDDQLLRAAGLRQPVRAGPAGAQRVSVARLLRATGQNVGDCPDFPVHHRPMVGGKWDCPPLFGRFVQWL